MAKLIGILVEHDGSSRWMKRGSKVLLFDSDLIAVCRAVKHESTMHDLGIDVKAELKPANLNEMWQSWQDERFKLDLPCICPRCGGTEPIGGYGVCDECESECEHLGFEVDPAWDVFELLSLEGGGKE